MAHYLHRKPNQKPPSQSGNSSESVPDKPFVGKLRSSTAFIVPSGEQTDIEAHFRQAAHQELSEALTKLAEHDLMGHLPNEANATPQNCKPV